MFYNSLFRYWKLLFCITICLNSTNINAQEINGFVFIDQNKNSKMDPGEQGLSNVMVSNQKDVVLTNEKGQFTIKPIKENHIFVTKPSGYQFKLDMFNIPEFHFFYRTKELKEALRYTSIKPLKRIPDTLFFPVYENPGEEDHTCLLIGDPQMKDLRRFNFYRDGVFPHIQSKEADFFVILGDIAHDHLGILHKEKTLSVDLGIPGYRVAGNHDINFNASKNKYATETFKLVYGPDNYSFDYGEFHYIILNTVIYEGWQKELKKHGKYEGGLIPDQLKWLENDLANVPANKTIVLLSHISLHEIFILRPTLKKLFKLLEKHKKILAVSGHMHKVIAYDYNEQHGWKSSSEFEGLVAGAACGSWWKGNLDEKHIPIATSDDGSPKGFFQMHTKGSDYHYEFYSANKPLDQQMSVYIHEDEIRVNWFVGKRTDVVRAYIDEDTNVIELQNFIAPNVLAEPINTNKYTRFHILEYEQNAHLWKAKLPEGLSKGKHQLRIEAIDSKGKEFTETKDFIIE